MQRLGFKATIVACFLGYITQAVVNNFAPLLFVIFNKSLNISLSKITLIVTVNFLVQLFVDAVSPLISEKIGYRKMIVGAHIFAALGLLMMGTLPQLLSDKFSALLISVVIYAIGGGIIEVLISPIAEACPTDNKSSVMSLLHSFYCWGTMATVLISTLFLFLFGKDAWCVLSCLWAIVPLFNIILFLSVPINQLTEKGEAMSIKKLFSSKSFFIFVILMISSGASEQAMSQWASFFAESSLGVNKALGDVLGICTFALMMGIARVLHSVYGHKISIRRALIMSAALNIVSYVVVAASPYPPISLLFCALCGFSSGVLWPGVFSLASEHFPKGGTALFAFLALAGDLGCSSGPALTGFVSSIAKGNINMGFLSATIFPLALIICASFTKKK